MEFLIKYIIKYIKTQEPTTTQELTTTQEHDDEKKASEGDNHSLSSLSEETEEKSHTKKKKSSWLKFGRGDKNDKKSKNEKKPSLEGVKQNAEEQKEQPADSHISVNGQDSVTTEEPVTTQEQVTTQEADTAQVSVTTHVSITTQEHIDKKKGSESDNNALNKLSENKTSTKKKTSSWLSFGRKDKKDKKASLGSVKETYEKETQTEEQEPYITQEPVTTQEASKKNRIKTLVYVATTILSFLLDKILYLTLNGYYI
ncbi:hypothetical protein C923_00987 [Plasmodium falciparum UGT5.1]|uniref:Uncharacterized protein n=1 Tax=Plasmodium falciparum UGT5.1 TaxID=1237627 RepID=W7JH53_PLAFA|nr:hypothetical protein C923_00987 [Plasmodium falciparum UGT5.1]